MFDETIGCSAEWHIEHSRPHLLVDYFNPNRSFSQQIGYLLSRLRDIQALCAAGSGTPELVALRNELSFHMVKMSLWWRFDFCPRAVTGILNPAFMSYVKAHIAHCVEDDSLFDLLTQQHYMRTQDADHVMVLGRQRIEPDAPSALYGLDGLRQFRMAFDTRPKWGEEAHDDFASIFIESKIMQKLYAGDEAGLEEWQTAQREHQWARGYYRSYFHRKVRRPVIHLYAEACEHLTRCQSSFGRTEMSNIVNDYAFRVTMASYERMMSGGRIAEISDMVQRVPDVIVERARTHVATAIDLYARPVFDTILDRIMPDAQPRCSGSQATAS